MGNPRTPAAKAKVTGAAALHPGRHASRSDPKVKGLGNPSSFLDEHGRQAWEGFKAELPWLAESDRAMVEIASLVRGRILSGTDVGVTAMSMLQSVLSKLGGSPADRSKVTVPDEPSEEDEFFGAN